MFFRDVTSRRQFIETKSLVKAYAYAVIEVTPPRAAPSGPDRPHTGRARNEHARRAILAAALDLAQGGLSQMTVDTVAARAGVGKQTIYRWWPSKWEVVLDALLERAAREVVVNADGPRLERLVAFLTSSFTVIDGPGGAGPLLKELMAHAQVDRDFAALWRDRFVLPRRQALLRLLTDAGTARHPDGDAERNADADAAVDLLFGGMWYRLLVGHGELDESYARRLAAAALILTPA